MFNNRKQKVALCSQTECKRGENCPNYASYKNKAKRQSFTDCMYHPSFGQDNRRVTSYEK